MGGVGDPEWRTNIEGGGRIFRSRFTLSSVDSCHADHPAQAFLAGLGCHCSSGDQGTPGECPARSEGVAEWSHEVLVHKAGGPYSGLVKLLNSARAVPFVQDQMFYSCCNIHNNPKVLRVEGVTVGAFASDVSIFGRTVADAKLINPGLPKL